MNLDQYAKTVRRMREAQRAYFKDRTNGRLQTAKELGAIVDRETANIRDGSMFCADMAVQNFLGDGCRGTRHRSDRQRPW